MVLEACMVIIDNSEYMRNGDYTPSRYQAQLDTVEIIFRRKTNENPENVVGLMSNGGSSSLFLSNLTSDYGQILSGLHGSKIEGNGNDFINCIEIACLGLKNRLNKNQRQRIIIFIGSPINNNEDEILLLGRKLKKNNISIDIINFGEHEINLSKLDKFIEIVNNEEKSSHLLTIPQGPYLLYEQVDKSAILRNIDNDGNGNGNFGDSNIGEFGDFGMDDPNMDPELALAIRLSLEEENSRKEREKSETMDESK